MTSSTALVIGATGGFGGAVAERLVAAGWKVRALSRDPAAAVARSPNTKLDWVAGDAMQPEDVLRAAQGADVIVHAANPPGYRNWDTQAPAMLEATIAAAEATGARILFPGNVYNFGPDAFPHMDEAAPQNPATRKGKIRVAMERRLTTAGVRVLIVRAGDFLGPLPGQNWLSLGLVPQNRPIPALTYPGPYEVRHAWAWLPDLAETCVRLLAGPLEDVETFHFGGHAVTGTEFAQALDAAVGRRVPRRRLPWIALMAAAPFNPTLREMLEMRYLWDRQVTLDNARIVERLGGPEPHAPLAQVLAVALAGQGALPRATQAAAA